MGIWHSRLPGLKLYLVASISQIKTKILKTVPKIDVHWSGTKVKVTHGAAKEGGGGGGRRESQGQSKTR